MENGEQALEDVRSENRFLRKRVNPFKFLILSFASIILIGTFLLMLPISSASGRATSLVDALFTATSATCVTGLVVKDTGTYFSTFGQIVILLLIQIGGLGYMTTMTLLAILLKKHIPITQRIIFQENMGYPTLSQIIVFAKHVFAAVIVFEFTGALVLFLRWRYLGIAKALKYAVFHSVSAFNNAGFDVLGNFKSLTEYVADPVVNITISVLIVSGGLGFLVLSNIYNFIFYKKKLSLHSKIVLWATLILIVSGALLIFAVENNNPETIGGLSPAGKFFASIFQSVTARTAGFNTISISKMTSAGLMVLIALMFIGASPGGTGGGVKTVTFVVAMSAIFSYIQCKNRAEIHNRSISSEAVNRAFTIIILSIMFIYINTILLCHINKFSLIQNLFEVTSAFGTVGLSTGITSALDSSSKLVLILVMFIGRVGILSPLMFLKYYHDACRVNLPEEDISVG